MTLNVSSQNGTSRAPNSNGVLDNAVMVRLPVAVDATGGDLGIDVQVEGAILACREFGVPSILVGPEDALRARLQMLGAGDLPIRIKHAPHTITMDDSPARAVRRKPDSSLCVACNLVAQGQASAVISAGNSGAMMAAGTLIFGLIPGIERPAIAALIPVAGDGAPTIVLDSGANIDCRATNLVQFALMGSIYCSSLMGIARPRVALLSNGSEPSKGTDIIRAAAMILSQVDAVNYVGYVEGRDVATGAAHVIVCDGFVGNVMLKSMEGAVRLVAEQLRHEAKKGVMRRLGLGLARGVLKDVFLERFDYTAHGGAPLLGLTKLGLVLHGSSDARAVKNAIRVADNFARSKMAEKITVAMAQLDERLPLSAEEILSGMFKSKTEIPAEEEPARLPASPTLEEGVE